MVSLATQKFVSDILNDAFQHCKLRGAGQSSKKGGKVRGRRGVRREAKERQKGGEGEGDSGSGVSGKGVK